MSKLKVLIFTLAMLVLCALPLSVAAADEGFVGGYTSITGHQDDSNSGGQAEVFQSGSQVSGNVTTLNVYVRLNSPATSIKLGVYQEASGVPSSLLGGCTISSVSTAAWNACTIAGGGITLDVAHHNYWFAILGIGGAVYFVDTAATALDSYTSTQTNLTALSSTFSAGTNWHNGACACYGGTPISG